MNLYLIDINSFTGKMKSFFLEPDANGFWWTLNINLRSKFENSKWRTRNRKAPLCSRFLCNSVNYGVLWIAKYEFRVKIWKLKIALAILVTQNFEKFMKLVDSYETLWYTLFGIAEYEFHWKNTNSLHF